MRAPDATDPPVPERKLDLEKEHGHRAKPISLYPLDFATAIKGLLAVLWPPKQKRKKKRRKNNGPS